MAKPEPKQLTFQQQSPKNCNSLNDRHAYMVEKTWDSPEEGS